MKQKSLLLCLPLLLLCLGCSSTESSTTSYSEEISFSEESDSYSSSLEEKKSSSSEELSYTPATEMISWIADLEADNVTKISDNISLGSISPVIDRFNEFYDTEDRETISGIISQLKKMKVCSIENPCMAGGGGDSVTIYLNDETSYTFFDLGLNYFYENGNYYQYEDFSFTVQEGIWNPVYYSFMRWFTFGLTTVYLYKNDEQICDASSFMKAVRFYEISDAVKQEEKYAPYKFVDTNDHSGSSYILPLTDTIFSIKASYFGTNATHYYEIKNTDEFNFDTYFFSEEETKENEAL